MASLRVLAAGLTSVGLSVTLAACASSPGSGSSNDVGYETVIAAIVLAESDAGGRAFEAEVDDGVAQVHVAAGGREKQVEVDLGGPSVTGQKEGDLDDDDRSALEATSTTLADAVRIAAVTHGDAGVEDVTLEAGDAAWKIEFTDGAHVAVSTADGAIIRSAD